MKSRLFIFLFSLLLSCSGKSNPKQQDQAAENPVDTNVNTKSKTVEVDSSYIQEACYLYAENKDTLRVSIMINGDTFTGDMEDKFFEKDGNRGTIKGEVIGDKLIGNYHCYGEGTWYDMEVAFQLKGDVLFEGIGALDDETGSKFSDRSKIDYKEGRVLKKVDCNP